MGLSGWLDPEGQFHPCSYGRHHEFAQDEMERLANLGDYPYESVDQLRERSYIPMGGSSTGWYVFLPINHETYKPMVSKAQYAWFQTHWHELDAEQQEMVSDWLEGFPTLTERKRRNGSSK
ncbi:hypothetical protein ACFYKX_10535 [Cytobacillus sp. FJAT-54145]|uniref:Uncharacterized protein n=1 Tax=Cytobacillus spartinae TaxID=3299023 RepID=A0ABW6KA57_9BACI